MFSTKPGAVNGPTPGCVISRCAAGQFSTSCSIAWEMEAKPGFDSEIGNRGPTEKPRQTKPIQQVRPRINSYIVNSCSFLLLQYRSGVATEHVAKIVISEGGNSARSGIKK